MPNLVHILDGTKIIVDEKTAKAEVAGGAYRLETPEEATAAVVARVREKREDDVGLAGPRALALGVGRSLSLGLTDVAARNLGTDVKALKGAHPGLSIAGEVGGLLSGAGAVGLAAKAGTKVAAKVGGGAVAKALVRGGTESVILGGGEGVAELAASDDKLTLESAASTIGSRALLSGAVGGLATGALKASEVALRAGGRAMNKIAAASKLGDDVVTLDKAGIRAQQAEEVARIEKARIVEKANIANDIAAHAKVVNEAQGLGIGLKQIEKKELRAIATAAFGGEKGLDKAILNDLEGLAINPGKVLPLLRQQRQALEKIVARSDEFINAEIRIGKLGKKSHKTRPATPGEIEFRREGIAKAADIIENNRALQKRLEAQYTDIASPKLAELQKADDLLSAPRGAVDNLFSQVVKSSVYGAAAGVVSAIPGGGLVAPLVGAFAANAVGGAVLGGIGRTMAKQGDRIASALNAFANVGEKVAPYIPALSSKVLANVAFSKAEKSEEKDMGTSFRARSKEIRSHLESTPSGMQVSIPSRMEIAKSFDSIRAVNPAMADKMEEVAVRRIEFIARKMPTKPDVGGAVETGPDTWQPPDMKLRTWARYINAAEDPVGVIERMASGSITKEDAEALREVYPEIYHDLVKGVLAKLPELKAKLPYPRRLALSILTGIPVDPVMDPRVFRVVQGNFANEPGSEGGMKAPRPSPQFGSVAKPTKAQQIAGG